ncbi:MAG TPA: UrcA family protein [Gammaproteobacteria bacterium]
MTTAKWILCLAASAATSLTSLSSGAVEPAADNPTRTVRAWDLDLTRPTDVQTLYTRVQNAAAAICKREARNHYRNTRRFVSTEWTESCIARAVDDAVRDADAPLLAALHVRMSVAQRD